MSKGTARRTIRVDPELWESARIVAVKREENLSDVVRESLRAYVEDHSDE
jgi:predicted transcriptional regulator